MRIEYLEEFGVLADCLSFSSAAARLDLTQSTLSKHVMQMEDELGVVLLDRDRRNVNLTDAGRKFLEESVRIVDIYRTLKRDLNQVGKSSDVVVGGLILNPRVISLASTASSLIDRSAWGDFRIKFDERIEKPLFKHLLDGDYDLLFNYEVDEVPDGILMHKLMDDPMSVVMKRNHPLARYDEVKLKDLKTERLVHMTGNYFKEGWDYLMRFLTERDIVPAYRAVYANNFLDIVSVDLGNDILIISSSALARMHFMKDEQFAVRSLANENANYRVCVYWRDSPENDLPAALVDQMDDTYSMIQNAWA